MKIIFPFFQEDHGICAEKFEDRILGFRTATAGSSNRNWRPGKSHRSIPVLQTMTPSYLHRWSPDSKQFAFVRYRIPGYAE